MKRRRTTEKGFTLLEVLVALAVLAIALASLLKGIFSNAANEAYLRDKTLAQWVAMNVVAEQQLAEQWPSKGNKQGSENMGGHEWFWRYEISETFDEDVRRLEVKVRASDDSDVSPLSSVVAFLPKPVN
jgi:general secretion pathway protein I